MAKKIKEELPPIFGRIKSIKEDYLPDITTLNDYPTDPQEFLDYVWDKEISVCTNCLLCDTRTRVTGWDGIIGSDIMIVLEGPGFLEDRAGIPLIGPLELRGSHCNKCTGINKCYGYRILEDYKQFKKRPAKIPECKPNYVEEPVINERFFIRSTGAIIDGILINKWKFMYPRHNWIKQYNSNNSDKKWEHQSPFFITNATLCRSTDVSKIKDMSPESIPVKKCKKWLTYQWAAVQPKIIIALGRVSLSALMGNDKAAMKVVPNEIIETKFGPVIFQVHPASMMREPASAIKSYSYGKLARTLEIALEYTGRPI